MAFGYNDGTQLQVTTERYRHLYGVFIMDQSSPEVLLIDPPVGDACLWIVPVVEQPDKHPPRSAWSGSDASDRIDLATQC